MRILRRFLCESLLYVLSDNVVKGLGWNDNSLSNKIHGNNNKKKLTTISHSVSLLTLLILPYSQVYITCDNFSSICCCIQRFLCFLYDLEIGFDSRSNTCNEIYLQHVFLRNMISYTIFSSMSAKMFLGRNFSIDFCKVFNFTI